MSRVQVPLGTPTIYFFRVEPHFIMGFFSLWLNFLYTGGREAGLLISVFGLRAKPGIVKINPTKRASAFIKKKSAVPTRFCRPAPDFPSSFFPQLLASFRFHYLRWKN
ncbi:MAG: hypothetical protein ACK555_09535 [Acidobacteriota bacterium]